MIEVTRWSYYPTGPVDPPGLPEDFHGVDPQYGPYVEFTVDQRYHYDSHLWLVDETTTVRRYHISGVVQTITTKMERAWWAR